MANDKFNWKGLFVNDVNIEEESSGKKMPESAESAKPSQDTNPKTSKFPDSSPSLKVTVSQNVLDTIVAMYESGFESLNQPGYDFYEYFKAIESVGSHEPAVYKMALTMAQTVDKKVNKELLLSKAEYYIEEIAKVHQLYLAQGTAKKEEIQSESKSKKAQLTNDIASLEKQIVEIKEQVARKKSELQSVDTSLIAEVSEIDQKITCNDIAKTKIEGAIVMVVNGIKNNL